MHRLILSEQDRIGIGNIHPKNEKNQDSTELTGDINYRKIGGFGSESDQRAFIFDGEPNIASRGFVDLLDAVREYNSNRKKFTQTDFGKVILPHTNEPECPLLDSNRFRRVHPAVVGFFCGTDNHRSEMPDAGYWGLLIDPRYGGSGAPFLRLPIVENHHRPAA